MLPGERSTILNPGNNKERVRLSARVHPWRDCLLGIWVAGKLTEVKTRSDTTEASRRQNKTLVFWWCGSPVNISFQTISWAEVAAQEIKRTISVKESHLTAKHWTLCDVTTDTLVGGTVRSWEPELNRQHSELSPKNSQRRGNASRCEEFHVLE